MRSDIMKDGARRAAAFAWDTLMRDEQIPTPYVRVDGTRVKSNVARLAAYGRQRGLGLRPHTKTHKSLRLARLQLSAGAVGLTVAKVGEGEVMADAGEGVDLLLAYPAVDAWRCRRVAALAQRATMRVAIDSLAAAEALSAGAQQSQATVGVLIDLDVGMGRTGVQSPRAALDLARQAAGLAHLRVDGLFCYPGHIGGPSAPQVDALRQTADLLSAAVDLFDRHGLDRGIISGGSTPTAYQSHLVPQLTEIRSGTYIFNDMNTVRAGCCTLADCAAHIICTVVSTAVPGQFVIDAGSKTLTSDPCLPDPSSGYGHILEYPQARISRLSEEHGQVDTTSCDRRPAIGERVTVIPNHICPCINLQDALWWREGDDEDDGELTPMPVDARGRLS